MIGVFDSGRGGLTAIAELRRLSPDADICFFADRKNSPYGTKSRRELVRLVKNDVKRLYYVGADRILMACCTASTVYPFLPKVMRDISQPIISPAAKAAAQMTGRGIIGVIATEATVSSGAFRSELYRFESVRRVYEFPLQRLVTLIENGVSDENITKSQRKELYELLSPMRSLDIDTLILGCTHFPHLEREIGNCLPRVKLVNPSREGALEIIKNLSQQGTGRTIYL